MSPKVVLLKTGLTPLNTVRPVNTAHPKTAVHSAKSKTHFSKQAQSTNKRPFYKQTTLTRRSVHAAKRYYYTGRSKAVNTASGCSRHMTGNIAYLLDFKEFNRGYIAFGGGAYGGRITGKGTLKTNSLDFKDVKDGLDNENDAKDKSNDDSSPKEVWILVDLPIGKRAIGTKWVFRNKKIKEDLIKNKARLVALKVIDKKNIDYEDSAFLYGFIEEEVYITQPPGFKDPDHPDKDVTNSMIRDSPFELVAYTDSDYAGATQDRKSNSGAEYVAAASCYGQQEITTVQAKVMLLDDMRFKGYNCLSKFLSLESNCLLGRLRMSTYMSKQDEKGNVISKKTASSLEAKQDSGRQKLNTKSMATLNESKSLREQFSTGGHVLVFLALELVAAGANLSTAGVRPLEFCDKHNMVAYLEKSEGSEGFHQIIDFLTSSHIHYALTESPTLYASTIEQFWQTAALCTTEEGVMAITATIYRKVKLLVTEASLRRHLNLEDSEGLNTLPTAEIFEQLALMGYADEPSIQASHETSPSRITSSPSLSPQTHPSTSQPQTTPVAEEKVKSLESELHQTNRKRTAFHKMIKRVKKLEHTIKTSRARRSFKVVLSDDEEEAEDPSKQGNKISNIDKDPTISLVQEEGMAWSQKDLEIQEKISDDTEVVLEEEEPIELVKDQGSAEKGEKEVSTVGAEHSTAIPEVSTAAANLVYIR
ncbi:retrovirus-related pol polyprotein from transposon TNT 1-94 [Tanacetum coccineum]